MFKGRERKKDVVLKERTRKTEKEGYRDVVLTLSLRNIPRERIERENEREKKRNRERKIKCVCVCVTESERDNEGEKEEGRDKERNMES